tara:strand:+ start:15850 stop:16704 length:855 start_codon:yes stop_codon:yes gene_type:complete
METAQEVYVNMKNSPPTAIIGGYDPIAKSFFSALKAKNKKSIFINVANKKIKSENVYNFQLFQLKKILDTLNNHKILDILFLGKINRPNLSYFKKDGEIDKYIPQLINSYMHGDGKILISILDIFTEKGFNLLPPNKVSESFFFNKNELNDDFTKIDRKDKDKSIHILNDLSKYDNAQSIVCINGYIVAIEAAEGTDNLLKRTAFIRQKLNQLENKAGLLTKIPKKNQSMLVDLPVIGLQTLKLIKKSNLNGIAIDPKFTIIHNKKKLIELAKQYDLKIYSVLN